MRSKPNALNQIESNQDVDQHLLQIALQKIKINRLTADAEEKIAKIKEKLAKEAEPMLAEISKLAASVQAYSEYNKSDLFEKKKSIELNFGIFGFRKSTKITTKKTTLDKLKALGLKEAIITKETPNKDILANYDKELLAKVDAKRSEEDTFWYEVKEDAALATNK